MSSKTKVVVVVVGLSLVALTALVITAPRSGKTTRMAASAVWGA